MATDRAQSKAIYRRGTPKKDQREGQFRSVGAHSARSDLRGAPGDLDGVGSMPPMTNEGPEYAHSPDTTPDRISSAVDPSIKEKEVQKDQRKPLRLQDGKKVDPPKLLDDGVRFAYDPKIVEAQQARAKRNQTRQEIGALDSTQAEAQAMSQKVRSVVRERSAPPAQTKAPAAESIPTPKPKSSGGVINYNPATQQVDPVTTDPQVRANQELRRLQDLFVNSGDQGMQFSEFVDAYRQSRPNSLLAKTDLSGGSMSDLNRMQDDLDTNSRIDTAARLQARISRSNMTKEFMRAGPGLLYQTLESNNAQLSDIQSRSASGAVSPADLAQMANIHSQNAAAYMASHFMAPTMGFNQLAAESLRLAQFMAGKASDMEQTSSTNKLLSGPQGGAAMMPGGEQPPVADQMGRQISAATQSPDPNSVYTAMAQTEKGQGASSSVVAERVQALAATGAMYAFRDFVASGGQISPNAAPVMALRPLTKTMSEEQFIISVAPLLASRFPDAVKAGEQAKILYSILRQPGVFSWGG